jgi:FMN phosphatase YigB (HAD superfamily)/DNA-binding XRE family transcriptional regulator
MVSMNEVGAEKALAKAIAEARRAAGFTQQQLCAKANLSYSTLAKIERGAIKSPSVFTVAAIAQATNTDVESLVGLAGGLQRASSSPYKQSKSGIRFVYFDINGVLVRFFQHAFTRLAEQTHNTPDMVESAFWHYNDDVCRGDMTMEQFNGMLAERLRVPSVDWQTAYLESIDPIEEAQECLRWASQHYKVGLLSNIMPGLVDAMFDAAILPRLPFSAVIESYKVGAVKPEPAIYEAAQAQAGVMPSEVLFIDNERANLMAAERSGWKVLSFDDFAPELSAERIKAALAFE